MLRAPSSVLARSEWQMGLGERSAILGLLAELHPATSIELGTFRGGSLETLAEYSGHVHSFDLTLQIDPNDYPNVVFHIGDSHVLLPALLAQLQSERQDVQFALVDGDHSPDGVRRDLVDLLDSGVVKRGAIVIHDTANEAVRRGVESVPFTEYEQISLVELDFVPAPSPRGKLSVRWGGLGLIVLDEHRSGPGATPVPRSGGPDPWARSRELRRQGRRIVGLALRRAGLHPSQLKAKRRQSGKR